MIRPACTSPKRKKKEKLQIKYQNIRIKSKYIIHTFSKTAIVQLAKAVIVRHNT